MRHDGLLFASGWYIDADEFTKDLVAVAVNQFRSGGLEGIASYFASAASAFAGLETTIDYYNNAEGVEGEWFNFIADRSGEIVLHYDPEMVGRRLKDLYLFGTDTFEATEDGNWVAIEDTNPSTGRLESMRVWVVGYDGMTFGCGWYNDGSGS